MNAAADNACKKDPPATSRNSETNEKKRKRKRKSQFAVQRRNAVDHQQRGGRSCSTDIQQVLGAAESADKKLPAGQFDDPNIIAPSGTNTTTPETAMPSPVKPSRLLYGDDDGNQPPGNDTCATKLLHLISRVHQDNVPKITIVLTLDEYNKLLQVLEATIGNDSTDTNDESTDTTSKNTTENTPPQGSMVSPCPTTDTNNESTDTTSKDTTENTPPQGSMVSPRPTTNNFPKLNQPTLEMQLNCSLMLSSIRVLLCKTRF
jgi:hypothetical protein